MRIPKGDFLNFSFFILIFAFFVLAVFYSACPAQSGSVQNPSVYNPAGIGTVPQSNIRSGLVDSSNPIDTNGNLIVTGNVRRGSHFRGDVPYRSTTSFEGSLGTSSLSSFLRDSAGSQDYGVYSNSYRVQPYFSPEETVTTTAPGRAGVLRPANTRIDGHADMSGTGTFRSDVSTGTDVFGMEVLTSKSAATETARQYSTFDSGSLPTGMHYRSSTEPQSESLNPDPSKLLIPDYSGQNRQVDSGLVDQDSRRDSELSQQGRVTDTVQTTDFGRLEQTEGVFEMQVSGTQPQHDASVNNMMPVSEEDATVTMVPDLQSRSELSVSKWDEDLSVSVQSQADDVELKPEESDDLMTSQSASLSADTQYTEFQAADRKRRDALERIRRQLDDLTRSIGDTSAGSRIQNDPAILQGTESITDMGLPLDYQQQSVDRRQSRKSSELPTMTGLDKSDSMSFNESTNVGITVREDIESSRIPNDLKELSEKELSVEAGRIVDTHTNLDSFSQAKFDQHLRNGQFCLTAGRYYEAAKSFELALMYKPDDPFCLAGKGHALFAAGEYVSSALFISRALEVYPQYTQTEVNLATILGGNERIEKRIADVEEWLTKSGSNQLGFLLSYIYYRTDKLDKAKLAIDVVSRKVPQSPAALALKAAIDEKLTTQ